MCFINEQSTSQNTAARTHQAWSLSSNIGVCVEEYDKVGFTRSIPRQGMAYGVAVSLGGCLGSTVVFSFLEAVAPPSCKSTRSAASSCVKLVGRGSAPLPDLHPSDKSPEFSDTKAAHPGGPSNNEEEADISRRDVL